MYNYKNWFSLSLFILIASNSVFATDTDELKTLLNNIQTMQATFEQSSINSKGSKIGEKTVGSMALKRPGKFRWDTTKTNKQLLIISENRSLLYDADLEQVIKRKMDSRNPGNPATLLSSNTDSLAQSFKIAKLQKPDVGTWFRLTPKTKNNRETGYQWIKIHFINGQLNAMQIENNLGQKTVVTFSNIVFNAPLPTKTFILAPPPNTEMFEAD